MMIFFSLIFEKNDVPKLSKYIMFPLLTPLGGSPQRTPMARLTLPSLGSSPQQP